MPKALVFCAVLLLAAMACGYLAAGWDGRCWLALGAYFLLNLAYSLGLKDKPLVDIAILVSGFLLRLLYGGAVTDIDLSKWLCLTVMAASFYMGLGKRRGERRGQKGETRAVLRHYSESFLDKNMYMCLALAVMFYALWTVDELTVARVGSENLLWTCLLYTSDLPCGARLRAEPHEGKGACHSDTGADAAGDHHNEDLHNGRDHGQSHGKALGKMRLEGKAEGHQQPQNQGHAGTNQKRERGNAAENHTIKHFRSRPFLRIVSGE